MATTYNPQWDRTMHVDTALMNRMKRAGYEVQHTGGGCLAWERLTQDGGYIWITDLSGSGLGEWKDRNKPEWLLGRYGRDDDWINIEDALTLSKALQISDTMRAPADGEQNMLPVGDFL